MDDLGKLIARLERHRHMPSRLNFDTEFRRIRRAWRLGKAALIPLWPLVKLEGARMYSVDDPAVVKEMEAEAAFTLYRRASELVNEGNTLIAALDVLKKSEDLFSDLGWRRIPAPSVKRLRALAEWAVETGEQAQGRYHRMYLSGRPPQ